MTTNPGGYVRPSRRRDIEWGGYRYQPPTRKQILKRLRWVAQEDEMAYSILTVEELTMLHSLHRANMTGDTSLRLFVRDALLRRLATIAVRVSLLLLIASPVAAQEPIALTRPFPSAAMSWTHTNVNVTEYLVRLDGVDYTLGKPAPSGPADAQGQLPFLAVLPAPAITVLNTLGAHSAILVARNQQDALWRDAEAPPLAMTTVDAPPLPTPDAPSLPRIIISIGQ